MFEVWKKGYYARQYVRICKYYNFKEDQQCNSKDEDNHITMEMCLNTYLG